LAALERMKHSETTTNEKHTRNIFRGCYDDHGARIRSGQNGQDELIDNENEESQKDEQGQDG
jgi:hypothetical protein